MDMLIVGLLQGALSYPFCDPVLTGERMSLNMVKHAVFQRWYC
jgi:hypothetical protein